MILYLIWCGVTGVLIGTIWIFVENFLKNTTTHTWIENHATVVSFALLLPFAVLMNLIFWNGLFS